MLKLLRVVFNRPVHQINQLLVQNYYVIVIHQILYIIIDGLYLFGYDLPLLLLILLPVVLVAVRVLVVIVQNGVIQIS